MTEEITKLTPEDIKYIEEDINEKRPYTNLTAGYFVFPGGNTYSKYRYSKEAAIAAFETLTDCVNCTNCSGCTSCTNCANCVDCTACEHCDNQTNLTGGKDLGFLDPTDTLLVF
ncbi:MAG: hypothetical protein AB7S44_01675 [Spirochaetales bacterium]